MDAMDEWRWPKLTIDVLQKCATSVEQSCRESLHESAIPDKNDEKRGLEHVIKVEAADGESDNLKKSVEVFTAFACCMFDCLTVNFQLFGKRFRIKLLLNTLKKMDGLKNFETFNRWNDLVRRRCTMIVS